MVTDIITGKITRGKITITVLSVLTTEDYEKLEDKLQKFLEEEGLWALIDDDVTGNTTVARRTDVQHEMNRAVVRPISGTEMPCRPRHPKE